MTIARADWPQLLRLLETALDLPEAARPAWLSQLDGPAPLINELRRLLEDRRAIETDDFLQALPSLPYRPAMSSGATGVSRTGHVGPYRLLREIGRGGMSTVWLAERADQQLKRQVALKLPHTGPGQDSLATRLLREREILSGLDHPHIARLYDVGITESGTPYLVMEYVEGERLLDHADQHKLSVPQRIALFRQVLSAVQHAHTKLLLHRDLKPSNILVNRAGDVKLLDFGIAKLVSNDGQAAEMTELTRAAGQPLTLMYASPEQLRGEALTTACDMYALGVVLYELLCGQHPIELKTHSVARAEDAVLHQEPRAPSRRAFSDTALAARSTSAKVLRRMLSGDLDAIVLRALAKAPEQRFGSVDAFSADIARWAAGKPVQARAPGAWYYLAKFVTRHRLGVGLGAAAMSALLVAGTVALVQGFEARREAQRAVAVRNFLLQMFNDVDPDLEKGGDVTARQLLDHGKARLNVDLRGQPALRAELLMSIGQAQNDLGDTVAADATLTQAVALFAELRDSSGEALALLIRCRIALDLNQVDLADAHLKQAQRTAGAGLASMELRLRLLEAQGHVARYRRDWPQTRAAFEAFIALANGSSSATPQDLLNVRLALAAAAADHGDAGESGRQFEYADKLMQGMAMLSVFRRMYVAHSRATAQWELAQFARIHDWLPQVLGECDKQLGAEKDDCSTLRAQEVRVLLKIGLPREAVSLVPDLLPIVARHDASPRRQVDAATVSLLALAWSGQSAGQADLAEKLARWSRPDADSAYAAPDRLLANNTLAEVDLLARRPAAALKWTARARKVAEQSNLGASRQARRTGLFEGLAYQALGRHEDALRSMGDYCLPGRAAAPRRVQAHLFGLNCARSLAATGRREAALDQIDTAVPVLTESLGADSPVLQRIERLRRDLTDPKDSSLPLNDAVIDIFS
jgi:eukaryotic-like serine/threonine-protein kinase